MLIMCFLNFSALTQVMTFLFPLLIGYFVLVMASRAEPTKLHTASPCCYPVGRGRGGGRGEVGVRLWYKPPTTNQSEYRILRVLYSLHFKHLFCWFRKKWQRIVVEIKGFMLCPHPTHHAFPVTVKNGCPGCPSLPHFSVYFIYCWTCSRPEYTWNISAWAQRNHQSINQSINLYWLSRLN